MTECFFDLWPHPGPMLMITEYCSHGDLLNFLRCHAQDFMAAILGVNDAEEEALYKNLSNNRMRRFDYKQNQRQKQFHSNKKIVVVSVS